MVQKLDPATAALLKSDKDESRREAESDLRKEALNRQTVRLQERLLEVSKQQAAVTVSLASSLSQKPSMPSAKDIAEGVAKAIGNQLTSLGTGQPQTTTGPQPTGGPLNIPSAGQAAYTPPAPTIASQQAAVAPRLFSPDVTKQGQAAAYTPPIKAPVRERQEEETPPVEPQPTVFTPPPKQQSAVSLPVEPPQPAPYAPPPHRQPLGASRESSVPDIFGGSPTGEILADMPPLATPPAARKRFEPPPYQPPLGVSGPDLGDAPDIWGGVPTSVILDDKPAPKTEPHAAPVPLPKTGYHTPPVPEGAAREPYQSPVPEKGPLDDLLPKAVTEAPYQPPIAKMESGYVESSDLPMAEAMEEPTSPKLTQARAKQETGDQRFTPNTDIRPRLNTNIDFTEGASTAPTGVENAPSGKTRIDAVDDGTPRQFDAMRQSGGGGEGDKSGVCDCITAALAPIGESVKQIVGLMGGEAQPGEKGGYGAVVESKGGGGGVAKKKKEKEKPSGFFGQMKEAYQRTRRGGLSGLGKNISGAVKGLFGGKGKATGAANKAAGAAGGAGGGGAGGAAGAAAGGGGAAGGAAGGAGGAMAALGGVSAALGPLGAAVGTVAGAFMAVKGAVETVIGTFQSLANTVASYVEALNPSTILVFNQAMRDTTAVIGVAMTPLLQAITVVTRSFANTLFPVMEKLAPVVAQVSGVMATVAQAVIKTFGMIADAMRPVVTALGDMFASLEPIAMTIMSFVNVIVSAAKPAFALLAESIRYITLPLKALGAVLELLQPAFEAMNAIASGFAEVVSVAIATFNEAIASLWGKSGISNAFTSLKEAMMSLAKTAVIAAASIAKFFGIDSFIQGMIKGLSGPETKDSTGLGAPKDPQISGLAEFNRKIMQDSLLAAGTGPGEKKEDPMEKLRAELVAELKGIQANGTTMGGAIDDLQAKLEEWFKELPGRIGEAVAGSPLKVAKATANSVWEHFGGKHVEAAAAKLNPFGG